MNTNNNKTSLKRVNLNKKDSPSKKILTRKDMIAYILKYLVVEFKDIDINDIKNSLESGIDSKHIKTINTKDDYIPYSSINYDILFTVKVPNSNEQIGMYINIEPQGSYNNTYKLIRRAIYYASRIISRQKGIDFYSQDYNGIKKVYSIWLDTSPSKDKKGSINSYTINETILSGKYKEPKLDYDLLNIIFAYISNDDYGEYEQLMKLLYMLFIDTSIEPDDKLNIIKDNYDNIEIDEELKNMCNYEEVIAYNSKKEGLKLGYAKGSIDATANNVFNCMNSFNVSLLDAIKALNIDESIKDKVIEEVNKKTN